MILKCPKCCRQYQVEARQIGAKGRQVRCSKCTHQWFQKPLVYPIRPMPESISNADFIAQKINTAKKRPVIKVAPIPPGSELPVVRKHRMPQFMRAASVMLFVASIIGMVTHYAPQIMYHVPILSPLYHQAGLFNSQGVALIEVSHQFVDEHETQLRVNGVIRNQSQKSKMMPFVKLSLLNNQKQPAKTVMFKTGEHPIESGQQRYFEYVLNTDTLNQIEDIQVDIGNRYELYWR